MQHNPEREPALVHSANEYPGNSCRLILPDPAAPDLYTRLQKASPIPVVSVDDATSHDIRVVDGRTDSAIIISHSLPTLVIVDPANMPAGLDKIVLSADVEQLELISDSELDSPALVLRIQLLKSRIGQSATEDIVRENAYTILQTVMRLSNDWMVLKGLDNTFLLATKYFCETVDLSEDEVIGKNDLEIGTPEELVVGKPGTNWVGYWELDKRLTDKGESAVIEPLIISEDEHQMVRESTTKVSLKDRHGNVFGLLVIVSAVKNLKSDAAISDSSLDSMWEKRSNLNKSPALLEMQKEKHVLELEKQATENAFIQKNQFVAAASHDIRQPLHALGLFIHALEQQTHDAQAFSILKKIKRCHGSISELLNSLLDISRLDANVVSTNLTHFNIDNLLYKLHDELVEKTNRKAIDFRVHSDHSIAHCDEILLERILRNLITNAVNHTTEGSVTVYAQRLGAHINIQVSDTGPGIPEEQQEAIFIEYYRIDSDSGRGFGLGLAIVKRLCNLLDINLVFESTVEVGTKFRFSVPLGESAKQNAQRNLMPPKISAEPYILVVDDDSRVLSAVQAVLAQHGCQVTTAESEQQLIQQLQGNNTPIDLLLIDYRLSNLVTGVQAIRSLHRALDQQFPAIVITGDTSAEGLREINESGHVVLHKPVLAETLLSAVNDALSIDLEST